MDDDDRPWANQKGGREGSWRQSRPGKGFALKRQANYPQLLRMATLGMAVGGYSPPGCILSCTWSIGSPAMDHPYQIQLAALESAPPIP